MHWDANIECPACLQIYTIDGQDTAMRVVRRDELAAVASRRQAYDDACKKFMALPAIAPLKTAFAAHLDGLKSIAAIHRYLQANSMDGYAISSFRKHWHGGRDWVEQHVITGNVCKIARLLGQGETMYDGPIKELETLKNAIGTVTTVMGRIATII